MPYNLIENKHITVQYNTMPSDYCMPSLQMANDHYNIGITLSGDRGAVTPNEYYEYHAGYVAMIPPFILHRTISLSDNVYSRYLIKFSPEFVKEFVENGGQTIFDSLYDKRIHSFKPEATQRIINMFKEMYNIYESNKPYAEPILKGMLYRLFDVVWNERIGEDNNKFSSPLTEPIIHAIAIINQFYKEALSLSYVAKEIGLSDSYLSRLFKQEIGKTFTEYLINVRLSNAKQLLLSTDKTVMQIAGETGFVNGDYLSACFKKKVGISPLKFRNMKDSNKKGFC